MAAFRGDVFVIAGVVFIAIMGGENGTGRPSGICSRERQLARSRHMPEQTLAATLVRSVKDRVWICWRCSGINSHDAEECWCCGLKIKFVRDNAI